MTKIKWLLLLSLPVLLMYCTRQNEVSPARGNVQFSMPPTNATTNGKVKSASLPAAVLLSITDMNNVSIEEDKKLALYSFGVGFTSESLSLKPGQYKLTRFMVLDNNGAVIYATPLAGSVQAQYVSTPLPLAFTVSDNATTMVTPQVLAIDDQAQPSDFVYASFSFQVIKKLAAISYYYGTTRQDSAVYSYANGSLARIKGTYGDDYYYTNNAGQLVENIDWNLSVFPAVADTDRYVYVNGLVKKRSFDYPGIGGAREVEFYYKNDKIDSAIMRFSSYEGMYDYMTEKYTTDKDGQITESKLYVGDGPDRKLYLTQQYTYDTYRNPTQLFPGLYYWHEAANTIHNIVYVKQIESIGDQILTSEIFYSYTYDKNGYPVTRIAKDHGTSGLDDTAILKYYYGN